MNSRLLVIFFPVLQDAIPSLLAFIVSADRLSSLSYFFHDPEGNVLKKKKKSSKTFLLTFSILTDVSGPHSS